MQSAKDLRGLARETLAILARVLEWNGTQPLEYELGLESGSRVAHVLDRLSPETLAKLMDEWGFPALLKHAEPDGMPYVESQVPGQGWFAIAFADEADEGSGEFRAIRMRAFRTVGDVEAAEQTAKQINQRFGGPKAWVDQDGDLALEMAVLLHEGVTAEHLKARFEMWRWVSAEIAAG